MTYDETFDIFFGTDNPINIGAMFDAVTVIGRDIGNSWTNTLVGGVGRYGSSFSFVKNESKKITVQFTKILRQNEMSIFRESLANALDFPQGSQKLLFNDQPNRYYNANIDGNIGFQYDVKSGIGTGTITFLIPDGLAHSTYKKNITRTTVDPNIGGITYNPDGTILIDINNQGNVEAYPKITIDNKVQNDYIGIATPYSIFELGHKDDPSGMSQGIVSSKTIINIKQGDSSAATGWGLFKPAGNIVSPGSTDFYSNGGSLTYGTNNSLFKSGLILNSAGSKPTQAGANWQGGFSVYTLPTPIQDLTLDLVIKFHASKNGQSGKMEIILTDDTNMPISTYIIQKTDNSANHAQAYHIFNSAYPNYGQVTKQVFLFDSNNNERGQKSPNKVFNSNTGQIKMTKKGQTLSWTYGGTNNTQSITGITNAKVAKIYIGIGRAVYMGRAGVMDTQVVNSLTLSENNAIGLVKAPNSYAVGSRNVIDMYTGKFTYILDPSASTIGNDDIDQLVDGSEPFSIPKGKSQIIIQGSQWANWASNQPDVTVSFEENFM